MSKTLEDRVDERHAPPTVWRRRKVMHCYTMAGLDERVRDGGADIAGAANKNGSAHVLYRR
ncbi:MAG: hypothetical protein ACR2FI_07255 [Burkholderiales bacterium]